MFIAALSALSRMWKQPKCPQIDAWIRKMWHVDIDGDRDKMECYSTIKKNRILPFAVAWMELEDVVLSEGFPGDTVVKNPPVNEGEMQETPGLIHL